MLIEVERLRKVYGPPDGAAGDAARRVVAVDDLTLSVGRGEVFGFLGPNGAGKTTTVKMLLGLVRPTSGAARLLGRAPGDPAAMARVGFLPEHFRFHPWLTAADFLDVHARLHGLTTAQRRERIPRLLARVGLADRAASRLGEFSKGMTQRVGLAQALINEPELVFLDEPTSGLDPVGRYEVRDLIRELRAAGVTVFLNSHYLSEVEVTCDRIAIVRRGRVVRVGTLAELASRAPELEIVAAGLTPEICAGLARWGRVAADPAAPDGASRVLLAIDDEAAIPDVAAWLVQQGARLHALAPRRVSLEEIFLHTMAEEGGD
jgi:ABC-2 type transport system ATP-binding protein